MIVNQNPVDDLIQRYLSSPAQKLPGFRGVIRNGQIIPKVDPHSSEKLVFSLARMDKIKRPELVVELGKLLPQYSFILAGEGPLERMISLQASRVPNIAFLGPISNEQKEHYFRKAAVFVNPSVAEGFPNTLIEAGIFRVPYVATYDPDQVISRYNLGSLFGS